MFFTLFLCGGPCHSLSSNSALGILFSSESSLFIQLSKKKYIFLSLYYYLYIMNIKILSSIFFLKSYIVQF